MNSIENEFEDNKEKNSEKYITPKQLIQRYIIVSDKLRLVTLAAFIRSRIESNIKCKIIIFVSCCDSVEFHYQLFARTYLPVRGKQLTKRKITTTGSDDDEDESKASLIPISLLKLHGNMGQTDRTQTFHNFINSSSGILICTDVAARGLDLPDVNWIVQYDAPTELSEYVHRVGRTARLGNQGNSLIFLLPSEIDYINVLKEAKLELEKISLAPILYTFNPMIKETDSDLFLEKATLPLQQIFESHVKNDNELHNMAKASFKSHIRAYSTHGKSVKHIFHVKHLHLGHMAKSFALRDAPSKMKHKQTKLGKTNKRSLTTKSKNVVFNIKKKAKVSLDEYSAF